MKRHQRISRDARQHAGWCLVLLAASVAAGVWAVRAWQSEAYGGALSLAGALVVLLAAIRQGREALRLRRMVITELYWDNQRSIRPRLF